MATREQVQTSPPHYDLRLNPAEMLRGVYYFLQYPKRPFYILETTPKCPNNKGIPLWPFLTTENVRGTPRQPTTKLLPADRDSFIQETAMLYSTLSIVACETEEYDCCRSSEKKRITRALHLSVRPVHIYIFVSDVLAILRLNLNIVPEAQNLTDSKMPLATPSKRSGSFTVDVFNNVRKAFNTLALHNCDIIVAKSASLLHFKEVSIVRGSNRMFFEVMNENIQTYRPKSYHRDLTKNSRLSNPIPEFPSEEEAVEAEKEKKEKQVPGWPVCAFDSFPVIGSSSDLTDPHLWRFSDTIFIEPSPEIGRENTIEAYFPFWPGRRHHFEVKHWTFDPKSNAIERSLNFWNDICPSDVKGNFVDHFQANGGTLAQSLAEERLVRWRNLVDISDRSVDGRLLLKTIILPILTAPPPEEGRKPTLERQKLENSLLGGWLNWFLNPLGFSKVLEEKSEMATTLRSVELI